MAERMVSMRGGLRFDLQHKKKRQANKGFAVSSSYVKEPLGQLTRLRQGAGKPDGQAYLLARECLPYHARESYCSPEITKSLSGSLPRAAMKAEAQTKMWEIHLGSATDNHELRGLFQTLQMWPKVKRLRGTFTLVPTPTV